MAPNSTLRATPTTSTTGAGMVRSVRTGLPGSGAKRRAKVRPPKLNRSRCTLGPRAWNPVGQLASGPPSGTASSYSSTPMNGCSAHGFMAAFRKSPVRNCPVAQPAK
jgi:hypothetical protein